MSRIAILTLVIASMLVGAVTMLMWPHRSEPAPGGAMEPLAGIADVARATDSERTVDLATDGVEGGGDLDAAADADPGLERRPLGDDELAAIRRKGPNLMVVLPGRARTPLADAEVFWIESREALRRAGASVRFRDPAELAVRFGLSARTDRNGQVQLPTVTERLLVAARHVEGWFGVRTFVADRHRQDEILLVEQDATLRVRVVAADDPSRGVTDAPVSLFERVTRDGNGGQAFVRIAQLVSDADGHATLEHVQLYRNAARRGAPRSTDMAVALQIPLAQPQVERFDFAAIPVEPIVLRLPGLGSLRITLRGFDGKEFRNAAQVRLRLVDRSPEFAWLGEGFDDLEASTRFGESSVDFPMVGPGLRFGPLVRLDDRDFTWDCAEIFGPRAPGEHVDHELRLPDWMGTLVGRFVDESGAPLRSIRPTLLLSGRAGRIEGERLPADAEGRFELPFALRRGDPRPPFELEVRLADDGARRGATLSLPALELGARTELGDITLSSLDLLARGRVVDERGVPIEGARVRLQWLRDIGGDDGGKFEWRDQSFVAERTAGDGVFEIHGDAPRATSFRLRADARAHSQAQTEPLSVGAAVDVVLRRTAEVRGRVIAPEWLELGMLTVVLLPRDQLASRRETRVEGRNGSGEFRLRDVVPGFYDLAILVRGLPSVPLRILGVSVSAEPDSDDPRIAELDLRGRLFRYRLRAIAADSRQVIGDPGSPLLVRTFGQNGRNSFTGYPWRRGVVEMVHEEQRLEIMQLGVGYTSQETTIVAGDTDLEFVRLQPVDVILRGARSAAGPGRRVRVSAVLLSDTGLPTGMSTVDPRSGEARRYSRAQLGKSSGAWLPADGDEMRMPISRPGVYRIVLRLYVPGRDEPVVSEVGDVTVRVGSDASSRIELDVDPAKVAAALQARD